ncbi:MAG: hypothetical protein AAFU85_33550 [Planctomycetota bacterium]
MAYPLTTAYVILFDLVLLGFLVEVLRRAGASGKLRAGVAIGLAAWIGLLAFLIPNESLYPNDISPVAFFVSIVLGVGAFSAIGLLTPIGRTLAKSGQETLLLPQGLRVFFGAGFLIEGGLGIMPQSFAILDGITHITAAFLCMKAAVLIQNKTSKHGELWTANLFGLTDIVVVACGLSFFLLGEVGPNHNVMLAALFAAPVFINLHFVSLWKLVAERNVLATADTIEQLDGVSGAST